MTAGNITVYEELWCFILLTIGRMFLYNTGQTLDRWTVVKSTSRHILGECMIERTRRGPVNESYAPLRDQSMFIGPLFTTWTPTWCFSPLQRLWPCALFYSFVLAIFLLLSPVEAPFSEWKSEACVSGGQDGFMQESLKDHLSRRLIVLRMKLSIADESQPVLPLGVRLGDREREFYLFICLFIHLFRL